MRSIEWLLKMLSAKSGIGAWIRNRLPAIRTYFLEKYGPAVDFMLGNALSSQNTFEETGGIRLDFIGHEDVAVHI